jgi:hypothetical protein
MAKNQHLENHEHAFLDINNVVQTIATFNPGSHNDTEIQEFAQSIGFVKAVCCCTYGKPYILDTWDETTKSWIETASRILELDEVETI